MHTQPQRGCISRVLVGWDGELFYPYTDDIDGT
jgi:hypothetical protein